jgi:hypothetical protein
MFGSFDVFSMFSRFRIRESFHLSEKETSSRQNKAPLTADAPVVNNTTAAAELLPVAKAAPADTLDLSGDSANSPATTKKATYTPQTVKPESDDSKAKSKESPDAEPAAEAQPEKELLNSKSATKIDLKMIFKLSDFQSLVTAVAEDAKDGQLDTTSYSNLNLGFHADLNAKAIVKETYKLADGQDGVTQAQKDNSRFSNLEASMIKSRGFEAASFYRESMKTSFKINETYRDGFLNVARKLSVRYSQDFHLNLKTVNQFNSQSEALSKTGDLQAYLGNTEALVDSAQSSGELIGQFFDTVDKYLNGAEDKLIAKVEDFMKNLASEMGIESDFLDSAKDTLVGTIKDFFDKVDTAISSVKANYITQPAQPAVTDIQAPVPEETTPEMVGTSEAVAAA